ncbi:ribonuclease D [Paratractidigestivibacter sp.]|uniref:ribonuclease D n=1 Tax=Paratractidigestivibacter sp. TaxID=2847316 RepID=UPI002AC9ABFA|nr:ribonuclease D [Paratractidigestivibacter sp.]
MYISTQDELDAYCEQARACRVIAVDTEFLREKTYFPRLCLIQVNAGGAIAAIDPILIEDLTPLASIFEDADVVKVFHACSQDLEVIFDGMGCTCNNVFDTQVAAAFLGHRQQIGYGALVEAYTGVSLAKAEALTDWSRRPLDPEQLVYAEDDVRYLPDIYESMVSELIERDRLAWVLPEMAEVSDPARYQKDPADAYLRLKRAASLTRRQLAIAREVCRWREETAATRDVPRKWLLSDEVIVELCRRTPTSLPRLRRIRGLEKSPEGDCRQVIAAIERGLKCAPGDFPAAIKQRARSVSPDKDGALDLMYAVLRVVADRAGLAPQVIASKDDLADLLAGSEGSRLLLGWRHEVAGRALERLLGGELGLTIKDGRIEIL